jgi:hypothetical protein
MVYRYTVTRPMVPMEPNAIKGSNGCCYAASLQPVKIATPAFAALQQER